MRARRNTTSSKRRSHSAGISVARAQLAGGRSGSPLVGVAVLAPPVLPLVLPPTPVLVDSPPVELVELTPAPSSARQPSASAARTRGRAGHGPRARVRTCCMRGRIARPPAVTPRAPTAQPSARAAPGTSRCSRSSDTAAYYTGGNGRHGLPRAAVIVTSRCPHAGQRGASTSLVIAATLSRPSLRLPRWRPLAIVAAVRWVVCGCLACLTVTSRSAVPEAALEVGRVPRARPSSPGSRVRGVAPSGRLSSAVHPRLLPAGPGAESALARAGDPRPVLVEAASRLRAALSTSP